ncbi:winged helix-turn-helix transcriptional regulator [Sphingobacterium sp. JUb56]|uniref:winged helix-turn-helix transcriptional regulator n=1 Tax=Sphingobacterium sp. JUb56 TaxID=2587145 RepID=UPI0017D35FDB|nr:DNA-binding HxlR family transcriptional regulator [Sphingobacterium sp. JUb56]
MNLPLKEMEAERLMTRTVYTSKPPLKVEYELTDFGKTLIPLLHSITARGNEAAKAYKRITIVQYE